MNEKLKAGLDYLDGATSLGLGIACVVAYGSGEGAVMLVLGIFWLGSFVAWIAKKITSRKLERLQAEVPSILINGETPAWIGSIRLTPLESYVDPEGITVITKARVEDVSISIL